MCCIREYEEARGVTQDPEYIEENDRLSIWDWNTLLGNSTEESFCQKTINKTER
jgi:hypothetical protein